jgi:hypothetical protein
VGFLIADDAGGIVLAAGINEEADDVAGIVAIPRAAVRKLTLWTGTIDTDPVSGREPPRGVHKMNVRPED